jgi:large subunit ribosomal protein L17
MHRHGYKGKKFGRQTDQRRALIKGLAEALILRESIETTLPKAKEVRSYTEKLITKAKKGDLHNRRQVIRSLQTIEAAHKLVDELAPKLQGRNSGYLRVKATGRQVGDGAQLATVSFVDDLKAEAKPKKPAAKKETSKPKTAAKKPSAKPKARANKKTEAK